WVVTLNAPPHHMPNSTSGSRPTTATTSGHRCLGVDRGTGGRSSRRLACLPESVVVVLFAVNVSDAGDGGFLASLATAAPDLILDPLLAACSAFSPWAARPGGSFIPGFTNANSACAASMGV